MLLQNLLLPLLWTQAVIAVLTTYDTTATRTTSDRRSTSTSTRSFDDASLSRAKASYQSSYYESLYGSNTITSAASYSTPLSRCTSSVSNRHSICNRAVLSIHKDGINDDPYSVDIEQCMCTSISKMIGCYKGNTKSQSLYLSNWSTRSCSALITGRIGELESGETSRTSRTDSTPTTVQPISSSTSTSGSGGNEAAARWAEGVGLFVMVGGLANWG
ncbi:hypothetical protein BJ875DRAFT_129176 [Amylocarpus encephaloides]|uniref:Uncharacterized protein n=1 Tax=Amylocarpus encephaloides TaxID=45428 RepID=A0A9P8C2M1_9HELO|nr:hypothetical protein BJ875DRAFT_129176 [Amylocarpus encephaloides]